MTTSTATTGEILSDIVHWYRDNQNYPIDGSAHASDQEETLNVNDDIRIEEYYPYLASPSSWLPVIEHRIHMSIIPKEYADDISSEWLSEFAAGAAIYFFKNGIDLLPVEPHIYGTEDGDLVAEFETEQGSMTSVISDLHTVLFGVSAKNPSEPVQLVIRRGSNKFRDELRSFTDMLAMG